VTFQDNIDEMRESRETTLSQLSGNISQLGGCRVHICPNFLPFVETLMQWKGCWNGATGITEEENFTLQTGIGENGEAYRVCTAGDYDLEGITSWEVGQLIIFDEFRGEWLKVDGAEDSVTKSMPVSDIPHQQEENRFVDIGDASVVNDPNGGKEGSFVVKMGSNDYRLKPIAGNQFDVVSISAPGQKLSSAVFISPSNIEFSDHCEINYTKESFFSAYYGSISSRGYNNNAVDIVKCSLPATSERVLHCGCHLEFDNFYVQVNLEDDNSKATGVSDTDNNRECTCTALISAVRDDGTGSVSLKLHVHRLT